MNRLTLLPAAALAAVVGLTTLRGAPPTTPAVPQTVEIVQVPDVPAPVETPPIVNGDPAPQEPATTPPADPQPPARTRPVPAEPAPTLDTVSTPPAPPVVIERRAPTVTGAVAVQDPAPSPAVAPPPPPPIGLPRPGVTAQVTLPDGSPWLARVPLPTDPQGFTWRTFQSRTQPGKRILGLHLYAQRQDPDLFFGTVRFSNGAVNPNGTGFCGAVYYDSLVLTATPGWQWVILPQKGQMTREGIWVIAAKPAKDSHLARPREMMEFAYALVPAGNALARSKAEAALRYTGLEIPQPFLDYGPAHTTLPTVDRAKYKAVCTDWTTRLLAAQATGTKTYIENIADFQADALGPHWMDGQPAAYAHGGYGIDPTGEFAEQVPEAVLAHAIMHRANVSRSFNAAFNLETGNPISLYEWAYPPNPALMSGEPGKESEVEIPQFLVGDYYTYKYPRFNAGKCAYEYGTTATVNGAPVYIPGLWDFYAHDVAHSIRAMRHALALVEYANDPAARDFLLMIAEINRYGWFSDRPDERTPKKNPGDGYWPTTLVSMREAIDANKNTGGWFDRNWAWSAFAGACAIEYERDLTKKGKWIGWGRHMLEARALATDKFGFSGRNFSPGNFPTSVSGIQTFHEMLVICHTVTLGAQVYGSLPANLAAINRKGLQSALMGFNPRDYGGTFGPPHWIGTANNNVELPALSDDFAYGEGDPAHVYAACALTYRADPTHPEVLDYALRHWHPNADLPAMLAYCRAMFPNKAWSVQMESVLEQKLAH